MRPYAAVLTSLLVLGTSSFGPRVSVALAAPPVKASKAPSKKAAADKAVAEQAAKEAAEKAEAERLAAERSAQEEEERRAREEAEAKEKAKAEREARAGRQAQRASADGAASNEALWDTREDPSQSYLAVGLRFRDHVVPKGLMNLFVDGGATVNAPAYGLEFSRRHDGLELVMGASYADYGADPMLFKSHGSGDEAYEKVTSGLKVAYATFDLLVDVPLDQRKRYSLLFGGGVGVGAVFGDLGLNQVAPANGTIDPSNAGSARNCTAAERGAGPMTPQGLLYCDASNDHYGSYKEPSWFGGGMVPSIFPWIALPQVGLRIKPMRDAQARIDAGLSTSGFFGGLSLSYILPVGGNDPKARAAKSQPEVEPAPGSREAEEGARLDEDSAGTDASISRAATAMASGPRR